ncbi:MAG: hypothetical protein ACOC5T_08140, partial [Elusimicrobiota bacterium]
SRWFGQVAGGFLPNLAAGTAAGAVGYGLGGPAGAIAGSSSIGFSLEGGAAYRDAKRNGASEDLAERTSAFVGTINSVLESVPIARWIDNLPASKQAKRSILRNVTSEVVKQGALEGTTEGMQEVVQNAFAKTYDENRSYWENVDAAVIGGGMMGGGMGTLSGFSQHFTADRRAVQKATDEIESDYGPEIEQQRVEKQLNKDGTLSNTYDFDYTDNSSIENARGTFNSAIDTLMNKLDVERKFKKEGFEETGLSLKKMIPKQKTLVEKGFNILSDINSDENLDSQDYTEMAFQYQRPDQANPKYKSAITKLKDRVFDWGKKELKDRGWLEQGFVERFQQTIDSNVKTLQKQIKEGNTGARSTDEAKQVLQTMKQYQKKLNEGGTFQYLHVPIKMWLLDTIKNNPGSMEKFLGSNILKKRESLTLEEVVSSLEEQGFMSRDDVDIRGITASYMRQISKVIMMDDTLQQAQKDGLVKDASDLTKSQKRTWTKIDHNYGPWQGKYARPDFFNTFESQLGYNRSMSNLESSVNRIMGMTKMTTFYNPLIMPMYDVFQGIRGLTLVGPEMLKLSKNNPLYKAYDALKNKDTSEYFPAKEEGLTSTPVMDPWVKFNKKIQNFQNTQDYGLAIAKAQQIARPIKESGLKGVPGAAIELGRLAYEAEWNATWKMDEAIRFVSYFTLRDRGYTVSEAAQRTAEVHGDYASVPQSTRRALNKVFWTPSFKIVMTKAYMNEAKAVGRLLKGQAERGDWNKGAALAMLGALWASRDFIMREVLDMERDQIFRRYKKEYTNEEGEEKEFVLTMSGPDLIPWRYYHRYKPTVEAGNPAAEALGQVKWELHPIYQTLAEIAMNQKANFEPVFL